MSGISKKKSKGGVINDKGGLFKNGASTTPTSVDAILIGRWGPYIKLDGIRMAV